MESIHLRTATTDDINTLHRFEQGVINAERPFDPTLKEDPTRYYDIEQLIRAEHIEMVVAVSGTQLIGCGYARIENAKPFLRHRQYAYLGFMYVEPAFRGKGINQLIIDALKAWSKNRNVTELRLDVYSLNDPAIKAYEKAGFARHMIEMRLSLADER